MDPSLSWRSWWLWRPKGENVLLQIVSSCDEKSLSLPFIEESVQSIYPGCLWRAEIALSTLLCLWFNNKYTAQEKSCLHFQMINLTETEGTDWFEPVSSQTPAHLQTSSISGHNFFLWHVAGKTYSITLHGDSSHTLTTAGCCKVNLR